MATPREGGRGAGRALVVAPDRSTTQAASRLDALLAAAQSKSASRVSTQAKPPDVPLRVVASQATALRAWEAPDDELVESELPLARREQLQERASRVQLCAALTREAAAQYHDEEQRRERERQDRQAVKLQEEQARKRAHVSSHREARLAAERAQIEADRRREQEHKAALREQLTTARARRAEAERQAAERQAQALAREAALKERAARERRAAAKAASALAENLQAIADIAAANLQNLGAGLLASEA
jgi:cation transport regulator ChaB